MCDEAELERLRSAEERHLGELDKYWKENARLREERDADAERWREAYTKTSARLHRIEEAARKTVDDMWPRWNLADLRTALEEEV